MLFIGFTSGGSTLLTIAQRVGQMGLWNTGSAFAGTAGFETGKSQSRAAVDINQRKRPNNDGTGTQWTGNWTTGRDAKRPMPFKGLFGPPFAVRTQRNFLVRR